MGKSAAVGGCVPLPRVLAAGIALVESVNPQWKGPQRGQDRQIAPGGARSLRFGRDDREEGWDDKPQTGGEQRGMIPKDCKRLAEVDFPIAVVSRHFRRERSPSGMDIVHLWWARRPLAAWSCSYPSSRPFFSVISTAAERSRAARRDSLRAN